jgi:LuxR family maltose regulon positive regulatory protein
LIVDQAYDLMYVHVDGTALIGARGAGSTSLLATKLRVPSVKPGYVARRRLIDRLDGAASRDLVLVCAPPGFGKTSLLAAWCSQRPENVIWLSLDPADNDPARFWRHLMAAFDRLRPGIAALAEGLLGPGSGSLDRLATLLVNQLESVESDVVVVLDDYHHVEDGLVHASVGFLVEHGPPQLHVVIATRMDPPLAVARLRAGERLAEIRAAELRFTEGEAADLLQPVVEFASPSTSAALVERTEGWAAGLQLAALSLRDQPSIDDFVASFSGSHRFVLDYLTEEVLERQPPEVRDFMLETSVLDGLTADLCDAVTNRSDSQAVLEGIERANLFLIPLDDIRGWWRFHHLFADLLRARLAAERPERLVAVHRAAAEWHDDRDMADEAISHARAAGDELWAARLFERHADAWLRAGEGATLRGWLDALPESLVATRPRLLLAEADLALTSGDTEAFERPLVAAEQALASAPDVLDEPYEPVGGGPGSLLENVGAALAIGRAHLAELSGDAATTSAFTAQADALLDEHEWRLGILVRAHESVAALLAGAVDEAAAGFQATFDQCRSAGERVVPSRSLEMGGLAHRAAGRLDEALAFQRAGLEWLETPGTGLNPAAGPSYVVVAEIEYERNRLDASEDALEQALGRCEALAEGTGGSAQPLANALATAAWLRFARGDVDASRQAMAEAVAVAPRPHVTSLLNPVPASAARFRLAQGDMAAAVRWTVSLGLTPEGPASFACEPEQLLLARVLIAESRYDDAARLLDRLRVAADARPGSLIRIEVLRALALAGTRRADDATAALRRAFDLGWDQGWRRVFLDEGEPMAALLHRVAITRPAHASDRSRERALALLAALESPDRRQTGPTRAGAAAGRLVEPLSEREMEVLGLLAAGRSNRQIADELFVTVDTVKKHVTHILGKLEAANRTEAAARARDVGLLDQPERPAFGA